jgi:hypothetical protein
VRIKLKHFMRYCDADANIDDSPLYIFDSRFAERRRAPPLVVTVVMRRSAGVLSRVTDCSATWGESVIK